MAKKSSRAHAFMEPKKAIGTKWVHKNKKDKRDIVVRNKARLVAQGHRQEEGVDYDEVFSPVDRVEAIRIFLAFASFMGSIVYQMDIQSAFLYGIIKEEVYVSQPPSFIDPQFLNKVYVDDIIFGSTKKSLCDEFKALMHKRFQMSSMGELTFFLGLQVKQSEEGIFISQDKYVAEILKKFDFSSVRTASTPIKTQKPLVKDEEDADRDVHLYRSMIGSLMYLTASRPDIMKSSTKGCQFLVRRLISWQCKKQTIVATSTTKVEYVAAANCGRQVLWIQNQMLDYGFNFMNTKIYIDNESKKLVLPAKVSAAGLPLEKVMIRV
nr:copia protein [Tanacetum cinerariifolium]